MPTNSFVRRPDDVRLAALMELPRDCEWSYADQFVIISVGRHDSDWNRDAALAWAAKHCLRLADGPWAEWKFPLGSKKVPSRMNHDGYTYHLKLYPTA